MENEEKKEWPKGVSPIKKEYIIKIFDNEDEFENNEASEQSTDNNDRKRKLGKKNERNKKIRGMNKNRTITYVKDETDLCNRFIHGTCSNGYNCKWGHNIKEYLDHKEADLGNECPIYSIYNRCPYGVKCRFFSGHKEFEKINECYKNGKDIDPNDIIVELPQTCNGDTEDSQTLNIVGGNIQRILRKKEFEFKKADEFVKRYNEYKTHRDAIVENFSKKMHERKSNNDVSQSVETTTENSVNVSSDSSLDLAPLNDESKSQSELNLIHETKLKKFDHDTYETRLKPEEKKRIDFRDKLYCAPLTTVGNLPFRRIIKRFGCDITCGEMAVANNILDGNKNEWALMRRHKSEDIFGIQLTGGNPESIARAAEIINKQTQIDFIDLNIGCPIDAMFNAGAGSALMGKTNKLREAIQGINYCTDCPVTVKLRTGIYKGKNIAHKLLPKFDDWGVQLSTLHGRSREQRYTKLADYNYIKTCVDELGDRQMALFGNGDIFSWEEYYQKKEYTGVSGIMIGRGALIKPWIFKEIKERQNYDIQASERLEIMNEFCKFGLEHWGTDTVGVNTTRRYLCDWQSFLHRYIPIGLMEVLPQKINDRPPVYFGRNELETLMASPKASDWIKLTEKTILGPAPESFTFIPKHKANAYEG